MDEDGVQDVWRGGRGLTIDRTIPVIFVAYTYFISEFLQRRTVAL